MATIGCIDWRYNFIGIGLCMGCLKDIVDAQRFIYLREIEDDLDKIARKGVLNMDQVSKSSGIIARPSQIPLVFETPLMKASYPRSCFKSNKASRPRLANNSRGVGGFGKMKWR